MIQYREVHSRSEILKKQRNPPNYLILYDTRIYEQGRKFTERIYYKAPLYHKDTAQGNLRAELGPGVDSVLSK